MQTDRWLLPPAQPARVSIERLTGAVLALVAHALLLGWLLLPDWQQPLPIQPPQPLQVSFITAPPPAPTPVASPPVPPQPPVKSAPVKPVQAHPAPPKPKPTPRPALPQRPRLIAASSPAPSTVSAEAPADTPVQANDAPPAPAAAASAPPAPAPITPPSFHADYLDNPAPEYPPQSRSDGEQGKVLLRVFVDAAGHADRVEIRRSSGFSRLDEAARATVRRWRFVPAKQGGTAVAAWVVVPISFSLEG